MQRTIGCLVGCVLTGLMLPLGHAHAEVAAAKTVNAATADLALATNRVNSEDKHVTRVMVETDPAAFVLAGYAAHVRVAPAPTPSLKLGVGLYGLTMPSMLAELAPASRDKGWELSIRSAYALFFDYHLSNPSDGFFIGIQTGVHRSQLARESTGSERAEYWAFLAMPRFGYVFRPFDDSGFYVMPWAGAGTITPIAGSRTLGDATYKVYPLIFFATLHVGWSLDVGGSASSHNGT